MVIYPRPEATKYETPAWFAQRNNISGTMIRTGYNTIPTGSITPYRLYPAAY